MIECQMPQDILKYKAKVIAGFTTREAICLFFGAVAGIVSNVTVMNDMDATIRMYITAFIVIPFLLFGFLKPFNMPLEKALIQIIWDNFICPSKRVNDIIYPEYEKFRKGYLNSDENGNKNKNNKVKIAKSKTYRGIR